MKTLLFLLILDFSGSMHQKINGQAKYDVLKDNIRSMNQSLSSDEIETQTGILTFGLNTKKKCDDIQYLNISTNDIAKTVDRFLPDAFSRTPLAESIRQGTDIVISRKVKKVFIFSDGADSCGKDPCKELTKANAKLIKANSFMDMDFIGIQLKKDDPKFECFRHNTLSNIRVNFKNIGEAFDVHQALADSQKKRMPPPIHSFGGLNIRGGPPDVSFTAKSDRHMKTWMGSFHVQVPEGYYKVKSIYPGARAVNIEIQAKRDKEIYWEDFFKSPVSRLTYSRTPVALVLSPTVQTRAAHRTVYELFIDGKFDNDKMSSVDLPFGEWRIQIVSPPWLKKGSTVESLSLNPESSQQADFMSKFQLEWVPVPDESKRWVIEVVDPTKAQQSKEDYELEKDPIIEISDPNKKVARYYLQAGQKSIPVMKGSKIRWIKSSN